MKRFYLAISNYLPPEAVIHRLLCRVEAATQRPELRRSTLSSMGRMNIGRRVDEPRGMLYI